MSHHQCIVVFAAVVGLFAGCQERPAPTVTRDTSLLARLPAPMKRSVEAWRADSKGCSGARRQLFARGLLDSLNVTSRTGAELRDLLGPPNSELASAQYVDPVRKVIVHSVRMLNYVTWTKCGQGEAVDQSLAEWVSIVVADANDAVVGIDTTSW